MGLSNKAESGTMDIRGVIGDFEGGVPAQDFHDALQEHNGKDLTIMLDSVGGVVSDGLSIYNAIMQYSGKVTVHVDTMAASIASVIACAADHVVINSNAQFMIHKAWTVAMGNSTDFRGLIEQLDSLDGMIADIYVEKTGASRDELMEMMEKETYLSAEDSVALGLADEVNYIKKERNQDKPKAFAMAPCVIAAKAKAKSLKMKLSL
jgi:ATP-dependent Clp protease protease subunit